jgi:lysozyme family protein
MLPFTIPTDVLTYFPWLVLLIVYLGEKIQQRQIVKIIDLALQRAQDALHAQTTGITNAVTTPPAAPVIVQHAPLPQSAQAVAPAPKPAETPSAHPVSIHDSPQIASLKAANARRWAAMNVKADKIASFDKTAAKLCAPEAKARYEKISATTGVPWFVVAVIHEREAAGNFNAQLGQGDPLDRVSVHIPAGRGPFFNHPNDPPGEDAFYRGALDALTDCGPFAAKWKDWSIGGLLTLLEEYNGLGYANRGVPSAYVWSGSDQYDHGKFVADHVYSDTAVDTQEGCAPLLSRMAALDPSIKL